MSPRQNLTRITLKGTFQGAKVVRGPDWEWGNQDGKLLLRLPVKDHSIFFLSSFLLYCWLKMCVLSCSFEGSCSDDSGCWFLNICSLVSV